jgi:hypothetical protein
LPDKIRERFHLDALRRAGVDVPSAEPSVGESPDFLFVTNGHRLGIEMTEFHLPPAAGKRQHRAHRSNGDLIVRIADRRHHEAGGPPLYVSVVFREHPALTRKDTEPLGRDLADAVLKYRVPRAFNEPAVEIPWENLPERIASIRVRASIDGVDKLWHADAFGWVAQINSQHVAERVRKKALKEPCARSKCDELWLVIANDPFSGAAPAEISDEALGASYEAPFDRLIWLLPHAPRAIDLRRRPPAA